MCGIAGITGKNWNRSQLESMVSVQRHRGPDSSGISMIEDGEDGRTGLGHNRLSIIDLSPAGSQPMINNDGTVQIVFNGEIYNYLELRAELADYDFRSHSDTEVILAAYEKWGQSCLDRLIGMFAFLLWDGRNRQLFAARDRFGVKPLYYSTKTDGAFYFASEIKALHAAGIRPEPDESTWSAYLTFGVHENSEKTFWKGINSLPAGHLLTVKDGALRVSSWYDIAQRSGEAFDARPAKEVEEQYLALLIDSVRLRFRSDVPVGINLSGGLDSSTLLGLVHQVQGNESDVKAFTFVTGDPDYDETPWVRRMLSQTRHKSILCELRPDDVPDLAASVQRSQDEPFGGIPTLAYARVFEQARAEGVIVLLDGQGLDEQWAGYDYYANALEGRSAGLVQGSNDSPVRPNSLNPEFRRLATTLSTPEVFSDRLRNLQYRDARFTKIPRALRFNDRVSMRSSTELREPFLDHRLFELALRQPPERKISGGVQKLMLRKIASRLLPAGIVEAPKRPLQTPQREWLRNELKDWARASIDSALDSFAGQWLEKQSVLDEWNRYLAGAGDNSFFVWQWISLGLIASMSFKLELKTRSS